MEKIKLEKKNQYSILIIYSQYNRSDIASAEIIVISLVEPGF